MAVMAVMLVSAPAYAKVKVQSTNLRLIGQSAFRFSDGDVSMARLTALPEVKLRFGSRWRSQIVGRIDIGVADTGLGSSETFSPLSKPFVRDDKIHLDLDRAVLTWRKRYTRITLGKQSVAWGVLDGLQVTDRFDAARRREFIFTDIRPERLARWGARLRARVAGVSIDAAAALDPTVSQLALQGDAFAVQAARFRAGIPAGGPAFDVTVSGRGRLINNGTYGLRLSKTFGPRTISVLAIHGPDTDPLFRPGQTASSAELVYSNRTLLGATFEQAAGAFILRLEGAVIPDQDVNTVSPAPLSAVQRTRLLLGAGVDWRGRDGLFLNVQLGVDHLAARGARLVRPKSDVISTVRLQKPFKQDTWLARLEVISALSDGDGVVRPAVEWQVSDQLRLLAGADAIFGKREGIFGQFRRQSRLWVRAEFAL